MFLNCTIPNSTVRTDVSGRKIYPGKSHNSLCLAELVFAIKKEGQQWVSKKIFLSRNFLTLERLAIRSRYDCERRERAQACYKNIGEQGIVTIEDPSDIMAAIIRSARSAIVTQKC
jgi:hypothetical protein